MAIRTVGLSLYKLLSRPYGGEGESEGKTSFTDFDEQYILLSPSWENLFHCMQAIVILDFLSLVYTPNPHRAGGCGRKVFMRGEKKLLAKTNSLIFNPERTT